MQAARSSSAISDGSLDTLGGVDDQHLRAVRGEGGAQALQHHAAEGDMRIRDHRHEAHLGVREQGSQPMGLVEGGTWWHGGRGRLRAVQASAVAREAAVPCGAAKIRLTSLESSR